MILESKHLSEKDDQENVLLESEDRLNCTHLGASKKIFHQKHEKEAFDDFHLYGFLCQAVNELVNMF